MQRATRVELCETLREGRGKASTWRKRIKPHVEQRFHLMPNRFLHYRRPIILKQLFDGCQSPVLDASSEQAHQRLRGRNGQRSLLDTSRVFWGSNHRITVLVAMRLDLLESSLPRNHSTSSRRRTGSAPKSWPAWSR